VKPIGAVPLQLPLVAVSVWPSSAVPEIDGAAVFCGAAGATAGTARVASDVDDVCPAAFAAVTATRSRWPTSAAWTVYVWPVALAMLVQLAPFASHCSHW
jgi:hypothetical protein